MMFVVDVCGGMKAQFTAGHSPAHKGTLYLLLLIVMLMSPHHPITGQGTPSKPKYEPTWESLDRHRTPSWFQNAKLGLFIYGPHPTRADAAKRGVQVPIPGGAWDKTRWDPERIAQLAADMGARYVVLCADAHSYFLLYPSKYADIPGSSFTYLGCEGKKKRDYVAELGKAVRKRGLRFGLYRNYLHPGKNPYWFETMQEMIDRYQPDTLWLDGDKLSYSAEELRSRELLAYYYNHSARSDEVACEDTLGSHKVATWGTRLAHGDWYRKEMSPPSDEISEGTFVRYEELNHYNDRSPVNEPEGVVNNMIEWLADCASKGGNLEPAVWWAPESMWQSVSRTLRQVGMWLEVNGEAIYDTRPWYDGAPQAVTDTGIHVRYTTKGDALYAILFRWPTGKFTLPKLQAKPGTQVRLLGSEGDLVWQQAEKGLMLSTSGMRGPEGWQEGHGQGPPCDHAYSFKITPRPDYVR